MKGVTTIKINRELRDKLQLKKIHPRESYNDVISKMLNSKKKKKGGFLKNV